MNIKMQFQMNYFRRPYVLQSVTALLALVIWACPLSAQFVAQPVNLAYLSQRADVIMQGRITKVAYEPMPGYPNIPTVAVTVAVDQSLRGNLKKTYKFREVLIGQRPKTTKKGYKAGQQYLLFLPSPSQFGLSSPIGLGQGRFLIVHDSPGKTTVMNEQSNVGLFRGVDRTASEAGRPLTAGQRRLAATERGPVALDEFVSLVKSLTTLPRIR